MKKFAFLLIITAVFSFVSCPNSTGGDTKGGGKIDKLYLAMGLESAARSAVESIERKLNNGFSSPVTINGDNGGKVKVTGTKTGGSNATGSYASSSNNTDIKFDFSDFSYYKNLIIHSGTGSYYYNYSGSTTGYTSSSNSTTRFNLNSCKFTYMDSDNKKYNGTASIDFYDTNKKYSADVTVTIEGGETFSF